MPCSTVRFAETYSRKPGELSLPGFCSTRPALRACLSEVLIRLFQKFVGSRGQAAPGGSGPQARSIVRLPSVQARQRICLRTQSGGAGGNPRRGFPPGCAWRQWAVPCSTVRFAETCSRKPGELSLPGFCCYATCAARRATAAGRAVPWLPF